MSNEAPYSFALVLLFLVGSLIFLLLGMAAARLIAPSKPNPEKLSSYECGESAIGHAWGAFNFRFYAVALLFILFEVEAVLLFPWALVLGNEILLQKLGAAWAWFALLEALLFIALLLLGLLYAWRKGFLAWYKPHPDVPAVCSPVPKALYEQVNHRYQGGRRPLVVQNESGDAFNG